MSAYSRPSPVLLQALKKQLSKSSCAPLLSVRGFASGSQNQKKSLFLKGIFC